jgi:hypothetical protein
MRWLLQGTTSSPASRKVSPRHVAEDSYGGHNVSKGKESNACFADLKNDLAPENRPRRAVRVATHMKKTCEYEEQALGEEDAACRAGHMTDPRDAEIPAAAHFFRPCAYSHTRLLRVGPQEDDEPLAFLAGGICGALRLSCFFWGCPRP